MSRPTPTYAHHLPAALLLSVTLLLAACGGPRAPVSALENQKRASEGDISPGSAPIRTELIVHLSEPRSANTLRRTIGSPVNVRPIGGSPLSSASRIDFRARAYLARFRDPADAETAGRRLSETSFVDLVERNRVLSAQTSPSRPGPGTEQAIRRQMRLEEAWGLTRGSPATTVAVIDAGFDFEALASGRAAGPPRDVVDVDTSSLRDKGYRPIPGEDYTSADADVQARSDHGTLVAGTIAEVCPECRILPIRAGFAVQLDSVEAAGDGTRASGNAHITTRFTAAEIYQAIAYAVDRGADVINLSLGFEQPIRTLALAVNHAFRNGVVTVGAAGNQGTIELMYPAAYAQVLSVGATTPEGLPASFSNFGPALCVVAPGYGGPAETSSGVRVGTSVSAGYVSGLAALIRSGQFNRPGEWPVDPIRRSIPPARLPV